MKDPYKKKKMAQVKKITFDTFLRNYYFLALEEIKPLLGENLDEDVSVIVQQAVDDLNEFDAYLKMVQVKGKDHHSFLIFCKQLERELQLVEQKCQNENYQPLIEKLVANFEKEVECLKQRNRDFNDEIRILSGQSSELSLRAMMLKGCIQSLEEHHMKYPTIKVSSFEELWTKFTVANCSNEQPLDIQREYQEVMKEIHRVRTCIHQKQDLQHQNKNQIQAILHHLEGFKQRLYVLQHKELIKHIVDHVWPLSYEEVDRTDIALGRVILVTDVHHHEMPYANPYRLQELENNYISLFGHDFREDFESTKTKQYKKMNEEEYNERYKK